MNESANGRVVIHTDGACRGNPGPGGWGAILRYGEREKELKGAEPGTTNNRMELIAAIEALRALSRPCTVLIYTDSQYLRKGILEWMPQWKKRNWQTAARKPVKNRELWEELDSLIQRHDVDGRGVKGHSGTPATSAPTRLPTKPSVN